jgi:hypothetical protein
LWRWCRVSAFTDGEFAQYELPVLFFEVTVKLLALRTVKTSGMRYRWRTIESQIAEVE